MQPLFISEKEKTGGFVETFLRRWNGGNRGRRSRIGEESGVAAQAAWISARDFPAGKVAAEALAAFGTGITSEQSVSRAGI